MITENNFIESVGFQKNSWSNLTKNELLLERIRKDRFTNDLIMQPRTTEFRDANKNGIDDRDEVPPRRKPPMLGGIDISLSDRRRFNTMPDRLDDMTTQPVTSKSAPDMSIANSNKAIAETQDMPKPKSDKLNKNLVLGLIVVAGFLIYRKFKK
jgi:hypothetical protein